MSNGDVGYDGRSEQKRCNATVFSKKDPDDALRKEVEHLRLEDSREELLGKKGNRGDQLR